MQNSRLIFPSFTVDCISLFIWGRLTKQILRREDGKMLKDVNLQGSSGMEGGFRLCDPGRLGSGLHAASSPLASAPPCAPPQTTWPTQRRQGCGSEDKLIIRSKRLGKNDVTHEEAQCIRLSMCLEMPRSMLLFFTNGSTGGKAGRKALCRFQNAGARWALGTESQVPTETESSPTLPTRVL